MDVVVGDLLTVEGKKYIVLEMLDYENNKYAFVNMMTDAEEATDEFYIFEVLESGINIVVDDGLREILLIKFQKLLQVDIAKIMQ